GEGGGDDDRRPSGRGTRGRRGARPGGGGPARRAAGGGDELGRGGAEQAPRDAVPAHQARPGAGSGTHRRRAVGVGDRLLERGGQRRDLRFDDPTRDPVRDQFGGAPRVGAGDDRRAGVERFDGDEPPVLVEGHEGHRDGPG